MTRAFHRACLLGGTLLVLPGCQWLAGYEDFAAEEEPSTHRCAALSETKRDDRGAMMVRVDAPSLTCSWIDRDEVTVAQYGEWLADHAERVTSWDPDYCAWKTVPSNPGADVDEACSAQARADEERPFNPEKPIRCVDWCDAEAFCRWSGKRLCYNPESSLQGPRNKPREWLFACSNAMMSVYPWGMDPDDAVCNVGQDAESPLKAEHGPLPVNSNVTCTSEFGARNLLGNVAEWAFGCNLMLDQDRGKVTPCTVRGGAYYEPLQGCIDDRRLRNDTRDPGIGFRCCADLTEDEDIEVSARPLPQP